MEMPDALRRIELNTTISGPSPTHPITECSFLSTLLRSLLGTLTYAD